MKKTSIALLIGLFAVGCDKPAAKPGPAPAMADPAMTAPHMAPPSSVTPPVMEEKKEEDKKPVEEAAPAVEPAKPEEPK